MTTKTNILIMVHMSDNQKKTKYQIYDFIVWYKSEYDGNSPSIREIAEAVELKSTSPVHGHLDSLVAEGMLYEHPHIEKGAARCIMVTGGKWEVTTAASD